MIKFTVILLITSFCEISVFASMKRRKIMVIKKYSGFLPQPSDFEVMEDVVPSVGANEFLVRAEYISVDPYMRSFAAEKQTPYQQFGFQVGKVNESKHKDFPVDSYVVSHSGWRDHVILNGAEDAMFGMAPYQPPLGNLPASLALGALGMPGMTAYLGFLEVGKPEKGNTVCVSSAAGAVGSLVGQIANIKGCKVIGFAGSDEKVNMLKQELGFDHAFNYKTENNIEELLRSVAPKGLHIYFDNVGGKLSQAVVQCMRAKGRVVVCGSISTYGDKKWGRLNTPVNVSFEAFSFTQWDWNEQLAAILQIKEWIESGQIKAKETITNGFEELPNAFIGMLKGENTGKAVVKVWAGNKTTQDNQN